MITFDPTDTGFPWTKHVLSRTRQNTKPVTNGALRKGCARLLKLSCAKGLHVRFMFNDDKSRVEYFEFSRFGRLLDDGILFVCTTFTDAYSWLNQQPEYFPKPRDG